MNSMIHQQFRPLTPEATPTLHDLSSRTRIYLWGCRTIATGLDPARWMSEASVQLGEGRAVLLLCHLTILVKLIAKNGVRHLHLNPSCASPLSGAEQTLVDAINAADPALSKAHWDALLGVPAPTAVLGIAAEIEEILFSD